VIHWPVIAVIIKLDATTNNVAWIDNKIEQL